MSEDRIRVFIAIELPVDIQKALGELEDRLKNPLDRITWVKPHNIHLTLKFLGSVPASDIGSIERGISSTAQDSKEFNITLQGTGVFPRRRSPRVIWVGISEGKDEVERLYLDIGSRLLHLGYPEEGRDFIPHITLGRVKQIQDIDRFIQGLHRYKENILGRMVVNSISLIKSTLTPRGPIYETLYTAKIHR